MKKALTIIALTVALSLPVFAQKTYVYTDASTLPLYGKITPDTFEPYSRLPLSMQDTVRKGVWNLARASSGLLLRFTSDAGDFSFKWTSSMKKTYANITPITVRGMALYVLDDGKWMYLGSVRPNTEKAESSDKVKASRLQGEFHEYMLYLSLYDGVKDLSIGVPEGCAIKASTLNSPRAEKPIIIYGTSILQGASASTPGMCSTAQLSRRADRVVINLGFSGNCLLEEPLARYMASYPDPGMFIIDNWNGAAEVAEKGLEKCVRILREAHPDTPILVVARARKPAFLYDDGIQSEFESKDRTAARIIAELKKEGMKNLDYVVPSILGYENSGTVDGTHFTDEAFTKWVDAVLPYVKKAYRNCR